MKRRFQGLASTAQAGREVPDGVFLVRVHQARSIATIMAITEIPTTDKAGIGDTVTGTEMVTGITGATAIIATTAGTTMTTTMTPAAGATMDAGTAAPRPAGNTEERQVGAAPTFRPDRQKKQAGSSQRLPIRPAELKPQTENQKGALRAPFPSPHTAKLETRSS
jgi:hypothetical protein